MTRKAHRRLVVRIYLYTVFAMLVVTGVTLLVTSPLRLNVTVVVALALVILLVVSLVFARSLSRAIDSMADKLERTVRAQRELMANISHELRTPLSRVRVVLDLIASGGDSATTRQRLVEITRDFEELERLVDDVLTTARLDLSERTGFPMRRLETTTLEDQLGLCKRRFLAMHGESHPLEVPDVPSAVPLRVDAGLLRRAISNLLDNAQKYSPTGSKITMRAEVVGEHAVITVSDRGMGISEEDLTQLFTPFFRGDKSRTRATGGVGLGLVLAKRIVEAHDGDIHISSTLGEGTQVKIRLPIAPAPVALADVPFEN